MFVVPIFTDIVFDHNKNVFQALGRTITFNEAVERVSDWQQNELPVTPKNSTTVQNKIANKTEQK